MGEGSGWDLARTAKYIEGPQMGVRTTATGALHTHAVTRLGCEASHTLKAIATVPVWVLLLRLHSGAMLFKKQPDAFTPGIVCSSVRCSRQQRTRGVGGTPTQTSHSRIPAHGVSLCYVGTCINCRRARCAPGIPCQTLEGSEVHHGHGQLYRTKHLKRKLVCYGRKIINRDMILLPGFKQWHPGAPSL